MRTNEVRFADPQNERECFDYSSEDSPSIFKKWDGYQIISYGVFRNKGDRLQNLPEDIDNFGEDFLNTKQY